MVSVPSDYPWSSYRSNAFGESNPLITPHPDYLALGASGGDRRRNYRHLFDAHLDEQAIGDIRSATNGNYVLGNKRFQDEIEKMLGRRVTQGKSGRPKRSVKR